MTVEDAVLRGAAELVSRIENLSAEPSIEELVKAFDFIEEVLNSHVLVKIDAFRYGGAIVIPDEHKRQPTKGIIVAISKDLEETMNLHIGDRILYSQFAGYLLKFDKTPIARCLGGNEILMKLKRDSPIITVEGS